MWVWRLRLEYLKRCLPRAASPYGELRLVYNFSGMIRVTMQRFRSASRVNEIMDSSCTASNCHNYVHEHLVRAPTIDCLLEQFLEGKHREVVMLGIVNVYASCSGQCSSYRRLSFYKVFTLA